MKNIYTSDKTYEIIPPIAASITESLRSIGYTIETAVADLIDNSISANSSKISIFGKYKGEDTALYILDDGSGMDEETLIEAMRLGSKNPLDNRKSTDLGRFGLGLKTASFSQCRKFSVITKKENIISSRYWDLDLINETGEWILRKDVNPDFYDIVKKLDHGTLIVWEKLDRIISHKDKNAEKRFNDKKRLIREHLSLVFHRFIENKKLKIDIGGVEIIPWNPFLKQMDYSYKKELPEIIKCQGNVKIKAWIMPHKSYFTEAEYRKAGYNKGWTPMQGFYVYRADRLLVAGGWLGLSINGKPIRNEHHYDLARICVDLTNGMDADWDIDIKKSKATPPDYLRFDLEMIAKEARKLAYETYVFRGTPLISTKNSKKHNEVIWSSAQKRNNKIFYSINSEFPLLKDFSDSLNKTDQKKFQAILKLLAETIPYQNIDFNICNDNFAEFSSPYENCSEEMEQMIDQLTISFVKQGYTEDEAKEQITILLKK